MYLNRFKICDAHIVYVFFFLSQKRLSSNVWTACYAYVSLSLITRAPSVSVQHLKSVYKNVMKNLEISHNNIPRFCYSDICAIKVRKQSTTMLSIWISRLFFIHLLITQRKSAWNSTLFLDKSRWASTNSLWICFRSVFLRFYILFVSPLCTNKQQHQHQHWQQQQQQRNKIEIKNIIEIT